MSVHSASLHLKPNTMPTEPEPRGLSALPLSTALVIMVGVTVYPHALVGPDGHASHRLATLVFWAMSAGLVRGVGFRPRWTLARWLLSGWACAAALGLGALTMLLNR